MFVYAVNYSLWKETKNKPKLKWAGQISMASLHKTCHKQNLIGWYDVRSHLLRGVIATALWGKHLRNLHRTGNWSKETCLLDLEGDTLGHSHADSGPQDTVSTDLPFSTVLYHSPKEAWSVTWKTESLPLNMQTKFTWFQAVRSCTKTTNYAFIIGGNLGRCTDESNYDDKGRNMNLW